MSEKTANVLITKPCTIPVAGVAIDLKPGQRKLLPEALADRVVAAGCGERIKARGRRLPDHGKDAQHEDL